jgi:phosphoribosylformylglycinamidine cyclo-ligase
MSYKSSGVDTSAADNWVEGIQKKLGAARTDMLSGVGDYAAVYRMSDDRCLATTCDGIGTKILWSLDGLGTPKALAQDLVAMNVNDLLCTGAEPKLFLDYLACSGKEALREGSFLKQFINGLIEVCGEHEQILAGGETAQMPDLYKGDHFDAAGFSVGFLKQEEFLQFKNLRAGLPVYGWKSSGPHSNGFTWLRKIFDSQKDAAFIREHLMQPTEIYVSRFKNARASIGSKILAAYHITGSGLLNLLRSQEQSASPIGFKLDTWPELPAWALEIQNRTKCSHSEIFSTFNCGIGFLFVCEKEIDASTANKLNLVRLGNTISGLEVQVPGFDLKLS